MTFIPQKNATRAESFPGNIRYILDFFNPPRTKVVIDPATGKVAVDDMGRVAMTEYQFKVTAVVETLDAAGETFDFAELNIAECPQVIRDAIAVIGTETYRELKAAKSHIDDTVRPPISFKRDPSARETEQLKLRNIQNAEKKMARIEEAAAKEALKEAKRLARAARNPNAPPKEGDE